MKSLLYIAFIFLLGMSFRSTAANQSDSIVVSHQIWDDLLQRHVDKAGNVNYKGFITSKDSLDSYLDLLSLQPSSPEWTEDAQLAYWINAYNAFTVKLIVDNYPVESIQDLHPTFYIPMVRTVWHKEFFKIGGEDMSLDAIEHKILRKQFNEPRIHFAIVCASKSCPKLLNEAFTQDKVRRQLDKQARDFLSDNFRNRLAEKEVYLSKIFSWFKGDFTKEGSLIEFLNKYSSIEISVDADINYLNYDWSLNE